VKLKSSERRELRDDLEHRSYRDDRILGTRSDFGVDRPEGYGGLTESPSFLDTWCHPGEDQFLTTTSNKLKKNYDILIKLTKKTKRKLNK